jgi:hypothetical protein
VIRMSTLLLAAVLDGPALWQAFIVETMDPTTALLRYLLAVIVASVLVAVLRAVAGGYQRVVEPDPAAGEPEPAPPTRM